MKIFINKDVITENSCENFYKQTIDVKIFVFKQTFTEHKFSFHKTKMPPVNPSYKRTKIGSDPEKEIGKDVISFVLACNFNVIGMKVLDLLGYKDFVNFKSTNTLNLNTCENYAFYETRKMSCEINENFTRWASELSGVPISHFHCFTPQQIAVNLMTMIFDPFMELMVDVGQRDRPVWQSVYGDRNLIRHSFSNLMWVPGNHVGHFEENDALSTKVTLTSTITQHECPGQWKVSLHIFLKTSSNKNFLKSTTTTYSHTHRTPWQGRPWISGHTYLSEHNGWAGPELDY